MSNPRDAIAQSPLFKEFQNLANFEDVSDTEILQLQGMILTVAEKVGPDLERIKLTFPQYTEHGIKHLLNVAKVIHKFLPRQILGAKEIIPLNALELTFLWLAILLHDIGMFVSDATEKQKLLDSPEYKSFLRLHRHREQAIAEKTSTGNAASPLIGESVEVRAMRDALFAEFIRRQHAQRVHEYIRAHLSGQGSEGPLWFREADLSEEIGRLCESHNWGVHHSHDGNDTHCVAQLNDKTLIGQTRVNFIYLSCCLRLGDILDFDRTRTPQSSFQSILFSEQISVDEWKKHLSIQGFDVTPTLIEYHAKCDSPDNYVAVDKFLNWVDEELRNCMALVGKFPADLHRRYPLTLPSLVNRGKVGMKNPNVEAGAFRFQLDYEQIMRLLMDKSLYPDEALFLRELLQNALDACRFQSARAKEMRMAASYIPRIQVLDDLQRPYDSLNPRGGPRIVFQDNGVGMSLQQVKQFFMRVGKSYYRSAEFRAERERLAENKIHLDACSQFGIGFLSCFMGGDLIEVETYQYGSPPLKITIRGPQKYFEIEHLPPPVSEVRYQSPVDESDDSPPKHSGTKITVYLREGWHKAAVGEGDAAESKDGAVFATLNAVAVNQEIEVVVRGPEKSQVRRIAKRRWSSEPMPWPESSELSKIKIPLAASEFPLSNDGSLHGKGTIWLLADENNRPNVRCGDILIRSRFNGFSVETSNVVAAVRNLCVTFSGESKDNISVLKDGWDEIRSSGKSRHVVFDGMSMRWSGGSSPSVTHKFDDVFSTSLDDDPAFVLQALEAMSRLDGKSYHDWYSDKDEVKLLMSGDRTGLLEKWLADGVTQGSGSRCRRGYKIALFGIETPGGFQTWDVANGSAYRHDFLPEGVTVLADVYGALAPQPAASRLFVPYERSDAVRAAIWRAFVEHFRQLWIANRRDQDWHDWYCDMVLYWKVPHTHTSINSGEIDELVDEIATTPIPRSYGLYKAVGRLPTPFAQYVVSEDCDGRGPWFRTSEPISQEQIMRAAIRSNLSKDEIDREVQRLSDGLGWDIRQGQQFPSPPAKTAT